MHLTFRVGGAVQLDIFDHSRDVQLRNDVLSALAQHDVARARLAWQRFNDEYRDDPSVPLLLQMIDASAALTEDKFCKHDELREARLALGTVVEPAATSLLGDAAGAAWLAAFWRSLARRAAPLGFQAGREEDHAAPLWLRTRDWSETIDAVGRIDSWRRIPAPLAWMAEARHAQSGLASAWPLLAELAWLSPGRFELVTRRLADPLLQRLRKAFDAGFDGQGDAADLAWFPAWVLIEQPQTGESLRLAQSSNHTAPERALRLLIELFGLERQGRHHEVIARRKSLRDLHAGLYADYMKRR